MTRLAELHPLPLARTETATPTRHSLRQTIARCDHARREAEAAGIVVSRLNDVVGGFDQLSAELRELCARDERHRGEWIAGGRIGPDQGKGATGSPGCNAVDANAGHASEKVILVIPAPNGRPASRSIRRAARR
jgi:hypothetical protein